MDDVNRTEKQRTLTTRVLAVEVELVLLLAGAHIQERGMLITQAARESIDHNSYAFLEMANIVSMHQNIDIILTIIQYFVSIFG